MRDGDVDDAGPLARRAECTQALQAIAYHAERVGGSAGLAPRSARRRDGV